MLASGQKNLRVISDKKKDLMFFRSKKKSKVLHALIEAFDENPTASKSTIDRVRGREDVREPQVLPAYHLKKDVVAEWPDVKSIVKIVRRRASEDKRFSGQEKEENGKITDRVNDAKRKTTEETTYYISSRELTTNEALNVILPH